MVIFPAFQLIEIVLNGNLKVYSYRSKITLIFGTHNTKTFTASLNESEI